MIVAHGRSFQFMTRLEHLKTPRVIIHAGHQKTGSSALQSSFALSVDSLRSAGIHYPMSVRHADAIAGRVTSGNFNPAQVLSRARQETKAHPTAEAILFSNEACLRVYSRDPEPLKALAASGMEATIVMFIRDPVEQAMSGYQQSVKRSGVKTRFDEWVRKFNVLEAVETFLDVCDSCAVPVRIANYSRVRETLLPRMEELIEVPPGTLHPPPLAQVNRSLTRAETEFLRALNTELDPKAAKAVADALCEELPEVKSERPWLSVAAFDELVERLGPTAQRINARIPADARYDIGQHSDYFGDVPPPDETGARLTESQMRAVARGLARWSKSARRSGGLGKQAGLSNKVQARSFLKGMMRRIGVTTRSRN